MKSSLCEDWSAEIRPEQYFSEHFLNHEQNLAKELVQALENGLSKNTPIFSKIIDYVKRTPLTTNDLLDSLFKLRDVIIQPTGKPGSSIEPSGKYTLKRNIEIAITQLSRLFERYDLDVQDQIIDQVHQLSTEGYLIELDKEFRILNLNQPLLQKFNYEKEEILGSPFSMLFSQPSQSLITYAQQQLSEKRRLSIELD
nr:hypothetical protein [Nitrosopumilaceae archaeon]NIU85971.1 hypothetical protein [Nitrosopumilaceae archaeon]NIV64790.1 hypothetical protein [Nitrosopumilaceae archaeon]NIX60185.1 hypothetical protein [Nitrosopumilaceae archaeon]